MDSAPAPDLNFKAPSIEELQPFFPAYEIQGFIAKGGMGAVYAARQVSLDRPVAIKILPRQFGADPQFRASFESEAKSMARLNHPNLIGVYDFGDAGGMLYIIMELVEGKSLHHSAHGKVIEQAEAARLVAGISHGLAHAHQHGILHRDIKPGNILLGPGAQPKIGDFGLARPVGEGHKPEEIVWGTPGYSAPEVVHNPDAVDERTDIFAVGVLLYELLTAKVPSEPWQPPSSVATCSPELDAVVRRATHPSPEMRYADAEELARKLDELAEKLKGPVLQRQSTRVSAGAAKTSAPPVGIRPKSPALTPTKSKGAPLIIAALLIGVMAVGAMILASSSKKKATVTKDPVGKPASVETPSSKPAPKPRPKPKPDPKIVTTKPPAPLPDKPEPPKEDPKPGPEPAVSPTEALAKVRAALQAGDLSKLPKGTLKRGNSHFFLVNQPLRWQAALQFAEDHGAQLAVLASPEDLAWAGPALYIKGPTWLGLSDSGTEGKWFWADGSPADNSVWAPGQPDDTPSREGGEDFAALLPGNILDDLAGSRQLPFVLQWSEGGNRGSLGSQLARIGAALKSRKAPIFPTGSQNVGGSRFLVVPRSTTWEQASALATAAGGHLAVPSSEEEAAWILDTMRNTLGGGDGCWVGGLLQGVASPQWTFVTQEKFEFVTWAPQEPDEGEQPQPALQVWRGVDGRFGYNNAVSNASQANYFLLEWSAPSHRNMPSKRDRQLAGSAEDWLTAQRQETADREKVAFERWKRRHEKNVEDFVDDIESEADTARRFNRAAKDLVDAMTESIKKSGEIPAKLGNEMAQRFLGRIHEKALERQKKTWEEYEADFKAAQMRYLADVKDEGKRRLSQGDRKSAAFLERELKAAAEAPYFLKILRGEFPEVPEAEEDEDEDEKN